MKPTKSASAIPQIEYPEPPFPAQHQEQPGLESKMNPAPLWRGESYRPANKLQGLAALVTGGDSGIGRAVAYFFAREGADVAITALPEEQEDADVTRNAIEILGRRCTVLVGDLAQLDFCEGVIGRVLADFGRLDVLVHNAAHQARKEIEDMTEAELDQTLKVNVYALIRLVRAAAPHMLPGSSIISTGSVVGLHGSEQMTDYGASKGAIHAVTRCLAAEFVDRQIRVNCVAPGPVWTPLNPSDPGLTAEQVSGSEGRRALP